MPAKYQNSTTKMYKNFQTIHRRLRLRQTDGNSVQTLVTDISLIEIVQVQDVKLKHQREVLKTRVVPPFFTEVSIKLSITFVLQFFYN